MLPKIQQPIYKTTLPISNLEVNYRPYLMKEHKIILIAMAGEETKDIIGSVEQIINNCTEGTVDANTLNSVDIGFLITKIRSASEGGLVELYMKCQHEVEEGKKCNHRTPIEVNLDTMKITGELDEEKTKIKLSGDIGIKLKIPGLDMFELLTKKPDEIIDSLYMLIDYVYDKDNIYKLENETKEDIDDFLENLNKKDINKIADFFRSMPKLKVDVPFVCEKCGHKETVVVEDIQSFLD